LITARTVLVDAGPLIAVVHPADQYYHRAQTELSQLTAAGWRLAIIPTTLLETHRVILRQFGKLHAHRWLGEAFSGLDAVPLLTEDWKRAVDTALRFNDQAITLFDTLLYVVSERMQLPIWTYDHHFDVLGSRVWRE
jgi:uncharacterized protein